MTAPRSPLARLGGEAPAPIGHNQGPPLDPGRSWRAHCWRAARKALVPRLPLEVVKRRVARARQLGLEYPQYASILLGTGRDVVAFLFTSEAIGLRVRRGLEIDGSRGEKLRALRCERLLSADPPAEPEALRAALARHHALTFAAVAEAPGGAASLAEGREALRSLILPLKLPADGVVVVGTRPEERGWADAARLAKFLSANAYFGEAAGR